MLPGRPASAGPRDSDGSRTPLKSSRRLPSAPVGSTYRSVPSMEPGMFLQRPSMERSQDISHVLVRALRPLLEEEVINDETVKNLHVSRESGDEYHREFVDRLRQVYQERDRRLAEIAMLERHLMQAQARATNAEEKELTRKREGCANYDDLGLPPVRSFFGSCLDYELLRKHKLITPDMYAPPKHFRVPPPRGDGVPDYIRDTVSRSQQRTPSVGRQSSMEAESEGFTVMTESNEFRKRGPRSEEKRNKKTATTKKKPLAELNAFQRDQERQDLRLMQNKINFIQNPRFNKDKQLQRNPFTPVPDMVLFSEYNVGQVYEALLELRNDGDVSYHVRVIPFKTAYFSVSEGVFPGEGSVVAPGLTVAYLIKFLPDAMMDYEDEICFQSDGGPDLRLPVRAARSPPVLTLPSTVDLGQCLIGGCKMTRLKIRNKGGHGAFCIVHASKWPASTYRSAVESTELATGPMLIRPVTFQLMHGDGTYVEVLFEPQTEGAFSEEVVIVCDNCTVQRVTITGAGKHMDLGLESDVPFTDPVPYEKYDATAQYLITLDPLHPFACVKRVIRVCNPMDIAVPFSWRTFEPILVTAAEMTAEEATRKRQVVCDRSIIAMDPQEGFLKPLSTTEFTMTFSPEEEDQHDYVFHLALPKLPAACDRTAAGVRPREIRDLVAFQIQVRGECVPFNVALYPYAVVVPGEHPVGSAVRQHISLINQSSSPVTFRWVPVTRDDCYIEVQPPAGILGSNMELVVDLSVTGLVPTRISETLLCEIEHLKKPLSLQVDAVFKGPKVTIQEPEIDFGLIRLGEQIEKEIVIVNNSSVAAQWRLFHSEPKDDCTFSIRPADGQLVGLGQQRVLVTYRPSSTGLKENILGLEVVEGTGCMLRVFSHIQTPTAHLSECELSIQGTYMGSESTLNTSLVNETSLPLTFKWREPEGADASQCSIQLIPREGVLGPKAAVPVTLQFRCNTNSALQDVAIPCVVEGAEYPLFLGIHFTKAIFTSDIYTPKDPENADEMQGKQPLQLDFDAVQLLTTHTRTIVVCNDSPLSLRFSAKMLHFHACTTYQSKAEEKKRLLKQKPSLSDKNEVPQTSTGVAFTFTNHEGVIQPWQRTILSLTVFADVWGVYQDHVYLKVGDSEPFVIPVTMEVVGTPVYFQISAGKVEKPILRIGAHPAGGKVVTRAVRVNNRTPIDIRIDWKMFNKHPDDRKLVDLSIFGGEPFPPRDSSGDVVFSDEAGTPREPARVPSVEPPTARTVDGNDQPAVGQAMCQSLAFLLVDKAIQSAMDVVTHSASITPRSETWKSPRAATDRPQPVQLLNARLSAHDGCQSDVPFALYPQQVVVPAKGHAFFEIAYTTPKGITEPVDHVGFVLGYLSIAKELERVGFNIIRPTGFDLEPVRLDVTAKALPVFLHVETDEDDTALFTVCSSDLIQPDGHDKDVLVTAKLTLRNKTLMNQRFKLQTVAPFHVISTAPLKGEELALESSAVLKIKLGFTLTRALLDEHLSSAETRSDGQRLIRLPADLNIVYTDSDAVQQVPFTAQVLLPDLALSTSDLDFGTVRVGQTRFLQLILRNKSLAKSFWSLSIEELHGQQQTAQSEPVLSFKPDSGQLEPCLTEKSVAVAVVTVGVTAHMEGHYEARLAVRGRAGELMQTVCVDARGCHDERHEAVLDV